MILMVDVVVVWGGGILEDEEVVGGLDLIGENEGEDGAQINVVMMSVQISSRVGE